jgi:Cu(I)/Ag(I) efflux system membrane protein CusA/SilA
MVGGMISSTVLTLVVIPAVYSLWKERSLAPGTVPSATTPSAAPGAVPATGS